MRGVMSKLEHASSILRLEDGSTMRRKGTTTGKLWSVYENNYQASSFSVPFVRDHDLDRWDCSVSTADLLRVLTYKAISAAAINSRVLSSATAFSTSSAMIRSPSNLLIAFRTAR